MKSWKLTEDKNRYNAQIQKYSQTEFSIFTENNEFWSGFYLYAVA